MQLTDGAKDLYTGTRTKDLQNFYGIKYDELWDEDRLEELGVTKEHLKEIKDIRGKELAYRDTVGFELGEGVMQSDKFKKLQEMYGITLEDTQSEDKLKNVGVPTKDIEFILGKKIKDASRNKTASKGTSSTPKAIK